MPAPYSIDIRKRIVDTIKEGKQTKPEIAERFCVSYHFVRSLWIHYQATGSVEPKQVGGYTLPKVDKKGEEQLKIWLHKQPDMTLADLCDKYEDKFNIKMGKSSMDRALGRAGISFKKKVLMTPKNIAKKTKN